MPKICQRYAQYMHEICPKDGQDMPEICPRYATVMEKIGSRYTHYMSMICPRYAKDMPRICPGYTQDMLAHLNWQGWNLHRIGAKFPQDFWSWGNMSLFKNWGLKCPWGILSFGAKCLGAKGLLAKKQWYLIIFGHTEALLLKIKSDTNQPTLRARARTSKIAKTRRLRKK